MQLEPRLTLATLVSFGLVACSGEANTPDARGGVDAVVGPDAAGLDATAGADALIELDAGPGVEDASAGVDAEVLGMCPPRGPFGIREGDVLPSPALVDCDGRPFDLHTLCGKTAAYQFHFAGW